MAKEYWISGRDVAPGDMVRVKRTYYYHYGIYTGDNEVVHFSAPDGDGIHEPDKVKVIKTDVKTFLRGGVPEVRVFSLGEKFRIKKPADIIFAALSRIGEGGYDISNNNCEDFANECVFGKKMPR